MLKICAAKRHRARSARCTLRDQSCAKHIPVSSCSMTTEKATFGAGCFWGVEETIRKLTGVTSTAVGYAGGTKEHPTYDDVCSDETGHAERVQVELDTS